jgi:exopolysaccharide biosynthesis polyprenyl glycosylphosphotransferase
MNMPSALKRRPPNGSRHLEVLPTSTVTPTAEQSPEARGRYRRFWNNSPPVIELCRSLDILVAFVVLLGIFMATNAQYITEGIEEFLLVRISFKNVLILGAYTILWPIAFSAFGLYNFERLRSPTDEAVRVVGACTMVGLTGGLLLLSNTMGGFPPSSLVILWLGTVAGTLASRHLLRFMVGASLKSTPKQILIVGSGPRAFKLYQNLQQDPHFHHEVVGFVDSTDRIEYPDIEQRTLGTLDQLENILMHQVVDEVLIALPIRSRYEQIQDAIMVCERVGVESRYLADIFQCSLARPEYRHSSTVPVVALKVVQDDLRVFVKRAIDFVAAGIGLIVLSPVLLAIAIAVKLTSPGPILFAQKRYGHNKRLFKMYKFRTMVVNAEALQISLEHLNEANGPVFKIKNDPRITRVGAFLRRTSLDELPQLFNVLRGDMSLVGPRPLPTRDVHHFKEAWLMRRFSVLPGLTCLWQISGRSSLGFDDWVTLDLHYIDQWSLGLDFRILLKTIPAVLKGTGAS